MVKNPPANAGDITDMGSVLRLGRSPGGGHGSSLQYSLLENPMDTGAWRATVQWVTELDMSEATEHARTQGYPGLPCLPSSPSERYTGASLAELGSGSHSWAPQLLKACKLRTGDPPRRPGTFPWMNHSETALNNATPSSQCFTVYKALSQAG